jgi:DNA-binding GntR family transcriptional regulator
MTSSRQTAIGIRYHERILGEIEAHDPGLAAAVMRRHINDFRVAWEKAGRDFHEQIADLGGVRAHGGRG